MTITSQTGSQTRFRELNPVFYAFLVSRVSAYRSRLKKVEALADMQAEADGQAEGLQVGLGLVRLAENSHTWTDACYQTSFSNTLSWCPVLAAGLHVQALVV